jgi:hypothetical protein
VVNLFVARGFPEIASEEQPAPDLEVLA